jgi:hypothetical protein
MKTDRNLAACFPALILSAVLCSCASAPPADLENEVHVFNVFRDGGEALPREVEGCEFLGSVSASAPAPELGSTVYSNPSELLETIRSRAHRKGADTAFVSFASGVVKQQELGADQGRTLRATIFRCGDSTVPQTLGSPVR